MKLQSTLQARHGLLFFAPLLDSLLIVSVFLLLGSQFVEQSGVAVELPVTRSAIPPLGSPRIITVTGGQAPQIFFDQEAVSLQTLRERLREAAAADGDDQRDQTVLLRADRHTPYETVLRISGAVLGNGFRLVYATKP